MRRTRAFRHYYVLLLLALVGLLGLPATADAEDPPPPPTQRCVATGNETVATGKADYAPGETVDITGTGYASSCEVTVKVTRPNGTVVLGDGSFLPGSDTVLTDPDGILTYFYILNGVEGSYIVEVLGADDALLASMTFTDSPELSLELAPAYSPASTATNYSLLIVNTKIPGTGAEAIACIKVEMPGFSSISATGTVTTGKSWGSPTTSGTVITWIASAGSTNFLNNETGSFGRLEITATSPSTSNPKWKVRAWSDTGCSSDEGSREIGVRVTNSPPAEYRYTASLRDSAGSVTSPTVVVGATETYRVRFTWSGDVNNKKKIESATIALPTCFTAVTLIAGTPVTTSSGGGTWTSVVRDNVVRLRSNPSNIDNTNEFVQVAFTAAATNCAAGSAVFRTAAWENQTPSDSADKSWVVTGSHPTVTLQEAVVEGDLELKKLWSGTAGNVTLRIGTSANGTQVASTSLVGVGGSTGPKTVNAGTYHLSEVFNSPTVAGDYTPTVACFDDEDHSGVQNGTEPAVTVTSGAVVVGAGDDVVCTYTNTRKQGDIELKKVWWGTAGNVTLRIGTTPDGVEVASTPVTGGGSTGPNAVNTGTYHLSEVFDTPTDEDDYSAALVCFDDTDGNGSKNGTEANVTVTDDAVVVGDGDDIICTFTNTREQGDIELRKVWSGTAGSITLQIGSTAGDDDIATEPLTAANGTTGAEAVDTGTYYISELFNTPTDGDDYITSVACFDDTDGNGTKATTEPAVTVGTGGSVAVGYGADVVCTYTNTIKSTATVTYNGQQLVMQGAKLVIGASFASSNTSICPISGRTVRFTFTPNPITGTGTLVKTKVTDSAGQATLTIDTAAEGWKPGTYEILIEFVETTTCFGDTDESVVTVASPADAATGGGAYQLNGRVNIGFNVHRVGTTTPAVYKGQILLMNNGKWRLKGTLDAFTKLAAGATGNRCGAGYVMGSAEGSGKLQYWDATAMGWLLSSESVRFSITFCDNTVTGKKVAADKFGIIIDYSPNTPTPKTPAEPTTLPNSLPIALSNSNSQGGGNISIKK